MCVCLCISTPSIAHIHFSPHLYVKSEPNKAQWVPLCTSLYECMAFTSHNAKKKTRTDPLSILWTLEQHLPNTWALVTQALTLMLLVINGLYWCRWGIFFFFSSFFTAACKTQPPHKVISPDLGILVTSRGSRIGQDLICEIWLIRLANTEK